MRIKVKSQPTLPATVPVKVGKVFVLRPTVVGEKTVERPPQPFIEEVAKQALRAIQPRP